MQITFDPFMLTADQAVLVGDFLARAAGVLPVSDRPDVGGQQMPLFTAVPEAAIPPTLPPVAATFQSPAPAPSAPAEAAPPAAPAAPTPPEKDARGLPHDERIHSANKTMNADGTWRRRSKITDDVVKQVEAELLGLPPAPPVPSAAELAAKMSAEPPAAPAAPVPAVVVPPVPAAPAPAATVTFATLANRAGPAMAAGRINEINAALAPLGLKSFLDLGQPANAGLLLAAEGMLAAGGLLT